MAESFPPERLKKCFRKNGRYKKHFAKILNREDMIESPLGCFMAPFTAKTKHGKTVKLLRMAVTPGYIFSLTTHKKFPIYTKLTTKLRAHHGAFLIIPMCITAVIELPSGRQCVRNGDYFHKSFLKQMEQIK